MKMLEAKEKDQVKEAKIKIKNDLKRNEQESKDIKRK